MAKKKVLIIVEGGLVQTVYAAKGTDVEVLDFDDESTDCRGCRRREKDCPQYQMEEQDHTCFQPLTESDIKKKRKGLKEVY